MTQTPDWLDYLRVPLALAFVAGLIFCLSYMLKRTGLDKRLIGNKGQARLKLLETLYLDPKHRLVIVRHDDREHLLLIGAAGDRLICSTEYGSSLKSDGDAA